MLTTESKIRSIAGKISGLPTLPTVISKMIELVDNPRTDTKTLAKLISHDQSLTARILKLANSAYYGFSREISTVDTAIIVMGFNAVKEMGLSLSVFDTFKNIGSIDSFDVNKYWEHSVACGVAAKHMAKEFHLPEPGEVFVAGLLHDIGKMIIIQYLPNEFNEINSLMVEKDIDYSEAELEVIGITHGEIGALIAERWHLPKRISTCIRHHHTPQNAPNYTQEAAVIELSDMICHRVRIGNDNHRLSYEPEEEIVALLGDNVSFTNDDIISIQEELFFELDKSDFLMSLHTR
jgi:putative nucleotidyltransferase with HDIG domain